MKCIYCDKKIKYDEPHRPLGLDGDFIHTECIPKWEKQCERINNMTDSEFKDWLVGV